MVKSLDSDMSLDEKESSKSNSQLSQHGYGKISNLSFISILFMKHIRIIIYDSICRVNGF